MALSAKVVTYTANTTTGSQALTGSGFLPKAAIVWGTLGNNAVDTFVEGFSFIFGFTDGTNSRCYCNVSEDNQASSNAARIARNDSIIVGLNQTGTLTTEDARASLTSLDSDGMTINWSNAPTSAFKFHVLYLGGADLTNVKVGDYSITGNNTNEAFTGVGFAPDIVLHVMGHCTAFNTADSGGASFVLGGFGCSNRTVNFKGSAGFVSEGGRATMDTWQAINTGPGQSDMNATTGAFFNISSIISLDSDGFTFTTTSFSTTTIRSYLALKGCKGFITSVIEPASTGTQALEAAGELTEGGKVVMVWGTDTATAGSIQTDNVFSLGAATATGEQAVTVVADLDNAANSVTTSRYETDSLYLNITPNATATSSTVDDEATLDSFTANGAVINWTNIGNARRFFYMVLGNANTNTLYEVPLTESSITVGSGTAARMLSATRTLSESSITVGGGTVARMLSATRSLSESSISVSESLERVKIFIRSISENAVDVSETLDRLRTAFAVINESAISVSETLTRLLTATRTITEDTITVSDTGSDGHKLVTSTLEEDPIDVDETVSRMLSATRTISESSISVNETLDRLRTAFAAISEDPISVSETVERTKIFLSNITEDGIDVDETLTKMSSFFRTLSESSIDIDEEVERVKTIIRTINESSISVSETADRLHSAFRTLSETAITVGAGTAARLATFLRSISESSISVSDSLESDDTRLVSLVETAISVTDSLTRQLKAFRTISESAIVISDSGSNGILVVPVLAEFITDPGYTNPVRLKLVFKSKKGDTEADESGDQIIYYNYDSWVPSDRPFNLLNFSMRLTQGEISSATLEIEDHAERIDDPRKIFYKAEVEVYFKKELGRDWTKMMTGVVRRLKHLRPAHSALHYQLTVVSKQIIYLERILNFARAAKRDGIITNIPLSTDTEMQVNNLFKEVHTTKTGLPNRRKETIQETGDFDLTTGSISDDVIDFITQVNSGLTTAADFLNQLTEGTGALWGVDADGNPYLRYPTEKHSGIILKDSPADTDSATNTSICMDAFEFEDIVDTTEGFANSLYVLNSKDVKVMNDSSSQAFGFSTLTTRWIAQSFIANENNVTGAAFILSLRGTPTNESGTIRGELRANNLVGGVNYPTGAILTSFEISFSQLATAKDTIFVNDLNTKDGTVIPGQRYWWVLKGTGLNDDSNTVKWHHDNDYVTPNRISAYLPITTLDLDPTTPGIQAIWQVRTNGPQYAFSTFSSINHILTQSDPESIKEVGLIEQVVNLPSFDDDATFQKVLVKMLQTSSKIKRVYDYARVTIPTARFFFPGELVTVIDSKAKLDADKFVNAEIVEVNYTVDTTRNALGVKYVDLRMIGFVDTVINNYLDNKEC